MFLSLSWGACLVARTLTPLRVCTFPVWLSSSQDLDAGVIVGVGNGRTYGKGLVQNVAELPYNNALKYTVAKYYTPSGR